MVQMAIGNALDASSGFRELMPKIKWRDLPPNLREHLFDRPKGREITLQDINKPRQTLERSAARPFQFVLAFE